MQVTYGCSEGFVLEPPTKSQQIALTCHGNGEWDGVTFVCHSKSCRKSPEIQHG